MDKMAESFQIHRYSKFFGWKWCQNSIIRTWGIQFHQIRHGRRLTSHGTHIHAVGHIKNYASHFSHKKFIRIATWNKHSVSQSWFTKPVIYESVWPLQSVKNFNGKLWRSSQNYPRCWTKIWRSTFQSRANLLQISEDEREDCQCDDIFILNAPITSIFIKSRC